MEKISLKIFELYNLDAELNGVTNPQTGEVKLVGLLAEKLKLTTKYWLTDLAKRVAAEKAFIETLKEDLIKKYGETDRVGNISISMYINIVKDENDNIVSSEPNPIFIEFQNEFNALLQEEKEIEYKPITLIELENIESNDNYPTIFKLIEIDE
jgi:hypothetical protein